MIGTSGLPVVYVARMDVEPHYRDEFMAWYKTKHAPDLIRAGFYSCTSYACELGGPWDCNVYEIPGPDLFQSETYQRARMPEHDPKRPEVLSHISDRSNTPYEQVLVEPDPGVVDWATGEHRGAVDAPAITALYFDCGPEDGDGERALLAWSRNAEFPRLRALRGFRRARLCRRRGSHINVSLQPQWLLLIEWESREAAHAHEAAAAIELLRMGTNGAASRITFNLASRTFTIRARPLSA